MAEVYSGDNEVLEKVGSAIKILLVEDVPTDAEMVSRRLRELQFNYEARIAGNESEFKLMLEQFKPDLILSDFLLEDFNAIDALEYLEINQYKIPFILVTGSQSEEVAVEVLKKGADDYILKTNLIRLPASIHSVIEKWKTAREKAEALAELEENRLRLKSLFDSNIDAVFGLDTGGVIKDVNNAACKIFRYNAYELTGSEIIKIVHPEDIKTVQSKFKSEGKFSTVNFDCSGLRKDGKKICLNVSSFPITVKQKFTGTYWIVKDITEKKNIESIIAVHSKHLEDMVTTQQEVVERIQDIGAVMAKITERAKYLIKADGAVIEARDGEYLVYKAGSGVSKNQLSVRLRIDSSASGYVYRNNRIYICTDTQMDPLVDYQACKELGIRSMIILPLREQGEIFGVLKVFFNKPRAFVEEEVSVLKVLAGFFEPALSLSNEFDIKKNLIEEKNRTLQLLSESESKYRLLAENASDMISIHAVDGTYQYVSTASRILLGYEPQELVGTSCYEFFHPDDIPAVAHSHNSILSQDIIYTIPYRIRKKDGSYTWFETTSRKVMDSETGDIKHLIAVSRDVSERKNNEMLHNRLARILDTSLAEIYIFHKHTHKFIQVNRTAEQNLGYTWEELQLMNMQNLLANGHGEKFSEIIRSLYDKNRDEITIETAFRRKDDTIYPVELRLKLSEAEDPPVFLAMGQDITERKKAEAELIEAKEKAVEMNRLKSSFLANMSHELRTPMIGILGYAEILTEELQDRDLKNMSESILKGGNRLLETLNLILDLSRIEAGKTMMKLAVINSIDILTEAIGAYTAAAEKRGLRLNLHCKTQSLPMLADSRMLREIFNNLINNAIKYTPEGVVEIEGRLEQTESGGTILISCRDTGIGIPEDMHSAIFDEFRQASEGYNRRYEGTGLGLTITKRFVEKMNGTIELKSKPGEGSEFIVKFPLHTGEPM